MFRKRHVFMPQPYESNASIHTLFRQIQYLWVEILIPVVTMSKLYSVSQVHTRLKPAHITKKKSHNSLSTGFTKQIYFLWKSISCSQQQSLRRNCGLLLSNWHWWYCKRYMELISNYIHRISLTVFLIVKLPKQNILYRLTCNITRLCNFCLTLFPKMSS